MTFNGLFLAAVVGGFTVGYFVPTVLRQLAQDRLRKLAYVNGALHAEYLDAHLDAAQLESIRIGMAYAPDFVQGYEDYFARKIKPKTKLRIVK